MCGENKLSVISIYVRSVFVYVVMLVKVRLFVRRICYIIGVEESRDGEYYNVLEYFYVEIGGIKWVIIIVLGI